MIVIRVCISTVFATLRRLSKHNALQLLQKEPIHLFYGVVIKRTSRLLSLLDSLVFETIFVHFEICNRLSCIMTSRDLMVVILYSSVSRSPIQECLNKALRAVKCVLAAEAI